jgi:hypothetical protein
MNNSIIVSAQSIIQDPPTTKFGGISRSGVRGSSSLRLLQYKDTQDSTEDRDLLFFSRDTIPSFSLDNNDDNIDRNAGRSQSVNYQNLQRNTGFVTPTARQCTTGKLLMPE